MILPVQSYSLPKNKFVFSDPVCIERQYHKKEQFTGVKDELYIPVTFNLRKHLLNRIKNYFTVSNENSDVLNFSKPLPETFHNTLSFLEMLPGHFLETINTEDLVPTPYGTFAFTFVFRGNSIFLEIGKTKIGFYSEYKTRKNLVVDNIYFEDSKIPNEVLKGFETLLFEE